MYAEGSEKKYGAVCKGIDGGEVQLTWEDRSLPISHDMRRALQSVERMGIKWSGQQMRRRGKEKDGQQLV